MHCKHYCMETIQTPKLIIDNYLDRLPSFLVTKLLLYLSVKVYVRYLPYSAKQRESTMTNICIFKISLLNLKELRHEFVDCNLCQSSRSLTIFAFLWLIIMSLVFFYLGNLLFSNFLHFKEARKGFLLLQWLWNDGRLQRRIFNGVGKLYVSLQLHCWAILWGYLWRHISYHGNAQGAQKRPLNFSFCKLSEKLIRWPTSLISLLESSLYSLTFHTVLKKVI